MKDEDEKTFGKLSNVDIKLKYYKKEIHNATNIQRIHTVFKR